MQMQDMASSSRGCLNLINIREDEGEGEVDATNCSDHDQPTIMVLAPAEKLLAEIFYQIFQNVDKKCLKNSREVCTTWRNAIDDDGILMRSLIFTIIDIEQFMNSKLASKVKSIRFIQPLNGTEKALEEFFIKIGSTVEQVLIAFEKERRSLTNVVDIISRQKLMFTMWLRFCTKLNTLTVKSEIFDYYFIKVSKEDYRNFLALSTVQSFSISLIEDYMKKVQNLVANMPNLRNLRLNCEKLDLYDKYIMSDTDETDDDESNLAIADGDVVWQNASNELSILILDQLQKYNGKLQEISLDNVSYVNNRYNAENVDLINGVSDGATIIIKLLLSIGQLYPNTNVKCMANLKALLDFKETEDIQINQNSCRTITEGFFQFDNDNNDDSDSDDDEENPVNPVEVLDTSRILYCSNLETLHIRIDWYHFGRISNIHLGFINELSKLKFLKIENSRPAGLVERDNFFNAEVFSSGIPSLTTFDIEGNALDLNVLAFHVCFPNVTKLYMRKYFGLLNNDFIYKLTNLDQLRCLTLDNIYNLTDEHLNRVYDFPTEDDDGKLVRLPSIAGFKRLKHLHIANCYNLTDNCLTNGLALCTKLDKITLCHAKPRCRQLEGKFTRIGLDFLQQARNFMIENLPKCHDRKHSSERSQNRFERSQPFSTFYTKNYFIICYMLV